MNKSSQQYNVKLRGVLAEIKWKNAIKKKDKEKKRLNVNEQSTGFKRIKEFTHSISLFETFIKNSKCLQQIEASLSFLQRKEANQKMD